MSKPSRLAKQMGDSGWRCLRTDPPPAEMHSFFVGHAAGGRIDYVFLWPHKGKMWFWKQGQEGNYPLESYRPNVWYPGPPRIPGSWRPEDDFPLTARARNAARA